MILQKVVCTALLIGGLSAGYADQTGQFEVTSLLGQEALCAAG